MITVKLTIILICIGFLPLPAVADHTSASFDTGAAGVILTVPGSSIPAGTTAFSTSVQSLSFAEISDARLEALGAAEEEVHSVGRLTHYSANIVHGLSEDLTVGVTIPYIYRSDILEAGHHAGAGEVEAAGDSSGIGDVNIFGLYRFSHADDYDAAVIAGIKTSTGNTSEAELAGGRFTAEHQPGSGSWDFFGGISFNYNASKIKVAGNLLYTVVTQGTLGTDLGDIINYNIALSRRWPTAAGRDHRKRARRFFDYTDIVLELNGDRRGRATTAEVVNHHSGGHTVYLSPGIKIGLVHRWSVYSSVGIPIVKDLNGEQSAPEYRLIAGIGISFK